MQVSKRQKERWNFGYEQKFIKFYHKFIRHTGNIKERLFDCFDDMEYAYLNSQSEGVPDDVQKQWQKIWEELLSKPIVTNYKDEQYSLYNFIHTKRFKSLQKYIDFFIEEYERITSQNIYINIKKSN